VAAVREPSRVSEVVPVDRDVGRVRVTHRAGESIGVPVAHDPIRHAVEDEIPSGVDECHVPGPVGLGLLHESRERSPATLAGGRVDDEVLDGERGDGRRHEVDGPGHRGHRERLGAGHRRLPRAEILDALGGSQGPQCHPLSIVERSTTHNGGTGVSRRRSRPTPTSSGHPWPYCTTGTRVGGCRGRPSHRAPRARCGRSPTGREPGTMSTAEPGGARPPAVFVGPGAPARGEPSIERLPGGIDDTPPGRAPTEPTARAARSRRTHGTSRPAPSTRAGRSPGHDHRPRARRPQHLTHRPHEAPGESDRPGGGRIRE